MKPCWALGCGVYGLDDLQMILRTRFLAPLLLLFISCGPLKQKEPDANSPLRQFTKAYSEQLAIVADYDTLEPDWKFNLQILWNGNSIYQEDISADYEFNPTSFPTHIKSGDRHFLLIEVNDRPLMHKLKLFTFHQNTVESIQTIPFFEEEGKDLDGDGTTEYWGVLNFAEPTGDETARYNPLLVYEVETDRFRFDEESTIALNKIVYGDFYGLRPIDTLFISKSRVEANWP